MILLYQELCATIQNSSRLSYLSMLMSSRIISPIIPILTSSSLYAQAYVRVSGLGLILISEDILTLTMQIRNHLMICSSFSSLGTSWQPNTQKIVFWSPLEETFYWACTVCPSMLSLKTRQIFVSLPTRVLGISHSTAWFTPLLSRDIPSTIFIT